MTDAELNSFLHGHRLTTAFPAIFGDLTARLQAAGVRRAGSTLIMPDGSPPGAWLGDQPAVRTALAREARRARSDAAAAPTPTPKASKGMSPCAAAQARQDRAARVTEKLASANGKSEESNG